MKQNKKIKLVGIGIATIIGLSSCNYQKPEKDDFQTKWQKICMPGPMQDITTHINNYDGTIDGLTDGDKTGWIWASKEIYDEKHNWKNEKWSGKREYPLPDSTLELAIKITELQSELAYELSLIKYNYFEK